MDDLLDLTDRAEATHFWFRGFRKFVVPVLRELAAGRRDLRLIDCGCGTGHNLRLLRPYGRAFGFDLTAIGSRRAHAAGHPVVRGDLRNIPFASDTFDIATSFDVMQCLSEDVEAVRGMARIVRPGGAVVLTMAALDALRGDHAEAWQEVRRYTPATARELIAAAGLQVERVSFLFASLVPMLAAVRGTQRLLRPFRTPRRDTDIGVPVAPVNAALTGLVAAEAVIAQRVPMPIGSSILVVARKRR